MKVEYSLVFPVYNESASVPHLALQLNRISSKLPKQTEVIFVDDGSTDNTFQQLKNIQLNLPYTIIKFSRNFGHQSALLAGLQAAQGAFVVSLDSDLQHPLKLLPKMYLLHKKGIDIVLTKRIDTNTEDFLKRKTSTLFYQILNLISSQQIAANSSDFRSLNRKTLNQLLALPEKRKFLRGMVEWIGFTQYILPYTVGKRIEGQSKYSLRKMIRLAITGITSYSTAPLYASAFFGLLLFIVAAIYALYVVLIRFVFNQAVEGWASLLFVTLVIGGFLSLFLGIVGLYIAAIYDEVKNRPNFIIQETYEKS